MFHIQSHRPLWFRGITNVILALAVIVGLLPQALPGVAAPAALARGAQPPAVTPALTPVTPALAVPRVAPAAPAGLDVIGLTALSNETLVNTTTSGEQWNYYWSIRSVAVQPNGSFIKVWIDTGGLDGQGSGIFMQRYDANGNKLGGETQVNTTTAGDQDNATIAVAPDGSFVVGWDGPGTSTDVFAQRFSPTGVKIGDEFLLSTTVGGNQKYPEMAFFPDGTFVAAFVDAAQTVLQRFDANGRVIGQETRISSGAGDVVIDSLSVRPDNTVLLTWTAAGDVYGQLFTSALAPIGTAQRMNVYTTGTQEYSIARADGQGRIVVVWESDGQDGSGMGVYGRRYDASFNPLGGEFAITTNTTGLQFEPQLAMNASGNFVVAWSDNNNRDGGGGTGESVWMRLFDTSGNPVGSEIMVNQSTTGYQAYPVIDVNDAGRLVVTWEGNGTQTGQVDSYGVYVRRYQLNQTGGTTVSVTPTAVTAGDVVTVTMALTATSSIPNVSPNTLSISGTNGVFATLLTGPTPISATVGTTPITFTWTYQITALNQRGALTFGGQADNNGEYIWPYATSNSVSVMPALFIRDLTAPNLVGDSNKPDTQGPQAFAIGVEVCNPTLTGLTDVVVYIGDGVTPAVFPVTKMTLGQTHNTYSGTFSLDLLANNSDATRPLIELAPAKAVIDGRVDFNGNGSIGTDDDGTLSNGLRVIDGRVDVNGDNVVDASDDSQDMPHVLDGYIDINDDHTITAADDGVYGGECRNLYWFAGYPTIDAAGQPTWGDAQDIGDDLRLFWTAWGSAVLSGTTRYASMTDSARVRNEISANANKIQPGGAGAYISGSPPRVVDGAVDVSGDGAITNADDGVYFGKTIIDGRIDMNGDGSITAADDGVLNTFPVIDGLLDANRSGSVTNTDDMMMTQEGSTFSITVHNATFGTVGQGYDENRDNLWDFDFWHQPIGEVNWNANAFRLVDIQSDITGTGGSCPLLGITTHYDNEPYLSRIFDGDLYSCGFDATYTYTFITIGQGSSSFTPYQEAASGSNNEKYNGDYCGDNPDGGICYLVSTGLPALALSKTGAPYHTAAGRTVTWTLTYTNTGTTPAGDPDTGNGVVISDTIPTYTTFVANSAACATYPCTVYYSTNGGATWSSTQPPASSVTTLLWHIEQPVPAGAGGTVSFRTTVNDGTPGNTRIRNTGEVKIGNEPPFATAQATVCASCVTIDKDTTTPIVAPGGQVTYTIAVRNTSDLAVTGLTISDTLPVTTTGSFTYTRTSAITTSGAVTRTAFLTPTVGSTTPTWGTWSLAPSGALTITFVATAAAGMAPGQYDNTAYASGSNGLRIDDLGEQAQDADTPPGQDPEPDEDVWVENPAIGIAKAVKSVAYSGGVFTLAYTLTVQNLGDVILSSVQVTDNLALTFSGAVSYTVVSVTAAGFTVNPGYNGSADLNLLTGSDSLGVGGSGTIILTVRFNPGAVLGPYNNSARAAGTSPAGVRVFDISQDGVTPGGGGGTGDDDPTPLAFAVVYGHVFEDRDGNGSQNGGEPSWANIQVVITDSWGVTRTVTTDVSGNYTATVPAGVTTADVVEASLPAGYVQTAGSDPTTVNAPDGSVTNIGDDGYQPLPVTIGDRTCIDNNSNSLCDASDLGIVGIPLRVTGRDVFGASLDITVTTSITGFYLLNTLVPGVYTVTARDAGGFRLVSNPVLTTTLTVGGGSDLGLDFIYAMPTAVQVNAPAVVTRPGEVRLSWTVQLYGLAASQFHVWRAAGGGAWKRLTAAPLEPASGDAETTAVYVFADTAVEQGVTYLYGLENTAGESFGPWSVRVPAANDVRRFLPWMGR